MKARSYLAKPLYKFINFFLAFIKRLFRTPSFFQDFQNHKDNTKVILFTNNDLLWPNYKLRHKTLNNISDLKVGKVSLIASVKNERDNVEIWFERILGQTHKPDEIIISDGGSTDGTFSLLSSQAKICPIPIQILSNDGGNIARGRNIAIEHSKFKIIAVTDFGCLPAYDWLENIFAPFMVDSEIVVSAGIYDPVYPVNEPVIKKKLWMWGNLEKISPEVYLPPGGSAAFQRKAWLQVDGYPEWLTLTGEDTYFDIALKQLGGKWAFVPDAVVEWVAPVKLISHLRKLFNWATGDGEMKIRGAYYWRYTIRSTAIFIAIIFTLSFPIIGKLYHNHQFLIFYYLIFFLTGTIGFQIWSIRNDVPIQLFLFKFLGSISQFFGYLSGVFRQRIINTRHYSETNGVVILLTGVPIDDTGGGARCTQIALEFLRRNYVVIYLHRFPKYENKDLNLNIFHQNLISKSIMEINFKYLIRSFHGVFKEKSLFCIVEHPIQEFIPVVNYINKFGGITIYEKIDAWDTSLGGKWYSENIETKFINKCHLLSATVPSLAAEINKKTEREVHIIPNAVNPVIFDPTINFKLPNDMPVGNWTGIYIGALWGDWFDWVLLRLIAETFPEAAFPIIGDFRNTFPSLPKNIHFLGLKKQSELPAYLKFANVSIIPWKINKITQATSPLKVFESIAMRCPVVAPCLNQLDGIPGVVQAKNREDFILLIDKCRNNKLDYKITSPFVDINNWSSRIQQILTISQ